MATLFNPSSAEPFRLSRSKVDLFLQCPRCFYLDRRLGIARPDSALYSLNLAVDALLKKEFDTYRVQDAPHPLMTTYGIDARPFRHRDLSTWRDTPTGIEYLHTKTNFRVFGIVDDVWQGSDGKLFIVDYKATSTPATITLDNRESYKRQMELYQWLFVQNGFDVASTGYFVFVNADRDRSAFDRKLEFAVSILPYAGSHNWVDDALMSAKECLMADVPAPSTTGCVWCEYRKRSRQVES